MKNKITVLLAFVVLASCSAPKYSYYFDHYNYHAGKNQGQRAKESPLSIDHNVLVASTANQPILPSEVNREVSVEVKKPVLQMTKSERKGMRHELKKEIRTYVAAKKNINSVEAAHATGMDNDLKLAAIFGAIGVVGLILDSVTVAFGIIGGIALIIGIVFFVKWLIRQ